MTDGELRGLLVARFYDRRAEAHGAPVMLTVSEFSGAHSYFDLQRTCKQLAEKGLLDWRPMMTGGGDNVGHGRLTADGIDEAEGIKAAPLAFTVNRNITVSDSRNVQVGDGNTQDVRVHIDALARAIDASNGSAADKAEAKSLLKKFLAHPIVVAVVGAAAGSLI